MKSRTPTCDRNDEERKICTEALRTGTFEESLSKLKPSELDSLQKSFHLAVTSFLNKLDCENDEFAKRNALVKTAFDELLAAKTAKSA